MRTVGIALFKTDVKISALRAYFLEGIKNLGS
jgi:hypothetical protein